MAKYLASHTTSDAHIQHPFRLICSGASGVGKTYFVKHFLENAENIVSHTFDLIIYCYSEEQPLYVEMRQENPNIIWIKGLSADVDDYLKDSTQTKLFIIDDQMLEGAGSNILLSLFTKRSHHSNTSIIFITQNMFFQGKYYRTISLNTTCFCIFKNPRDQRQIRSIAAQICPWNPKFICEAYHDATKEPYSYLFIDLRPDLADKLRIRTHIFNKDCQIVYLEK
jgi:hypothetical protein